MFSLPWELSDVLPSNLDSCQNNYASKDVDNTTYVRHTLETHSLSKIILHDIDVLIPFGIVTV